MNISPIRRIGALFGALALAGLGGSIPAAGHPKLGIGDSFPEWRQFPVEGNLPERSNANIVLVDFWASWCGPCKASFPVMEALHRRYGKDGLIIIAVNLDEKREQMDDFLRQYPVTFAIVRDVGKKLVGTVSISSMPTSFILDREGKVMAVHNGFHGEETRRQYVQEIEGLLKSKVAAN
jgi:thiol-disulfide isomerase/thioredoxin